MKPDDTAAELSKVIPQNLAHDLIRDFIELRNDCKTGTLGRASGGKFVETCVQVLQFLDTGKCDDKPAVDAYLKNVESSSTKLSDDLRICLARIARAAYTLRNKRNILHKGQVDPNVYDLRLIYASAQWALSEIVRQTITGNMTSAGKIIEFIQLPVSSVIEDFGDRKTVYGNLTVDREILVLLHSHYPDFVSPARIKLSLDRRSESAVSNALSRLWKQKSVHRAADGYKLTQRGFAEAAEVLTDIA